uniref:RING-type E3 ubiquitin transferase n=2 Tax=Fopius arisanus TaxID=64838 RepID=A0A0C9RWS2_9HYME
MATYLKRTSKLFDVSSLQASTEMNLRDVICPVCRGILIEPVTLPCTHSLCLRCLKGTFEHNSLSCPLCRVRVGSWLRSATKSETLINSELWHLIRSRFPKEIEDKRCDHDNEIPTDPGYPPKIISAAGEIRREYERQLQIAEEEMRIQRKAEIMANEALIRRLQEEEEQKVAQCAQDQLLAKKLAKKQLLTKEKNGILYNKSTNIEIPSNEIEIMPLNSGSSTINSDSICHTKNEGNDISKIDSNFHLEKSSKSCGNLILDLKLAANRTASSQAPISVHNVVTLKNQSVMSIQKLNPNYSEPSCSNSKIYGTRSEEELRVPSDVLSSTKSVGIEFCIKTVKNDDDRIGSAESAGSHDSINQEIHHFKPIKAVPRTALKFSQDGKQIDPKLIRVVPIFESVSNVRPKPPTPSKRIIGCSWSAFREFMIAGKAKQNPQADGDAVWQAPSLNEPCQKFKTRKPESVRKIDLAQDISFDNNINCGKGMDRILNGTKVKLIMEKETDNSADKTWKKFKNSNERNEFSADENFSPSWSQALLKMPLSDENGAAVENIAERIKKRKVAQSHTIDPITNQIPSPRETRSRILPSRKKKGNSSSKSKRKMAAKSKNLKVQFTTKTEIITSPVIVDVEMKTIKATRKSSRSKCKGVGESTEKIYRETNGSLDDMAIEEQGKMERILRQEKEDYEFAQRLQAQFNEVESISYRTRGSKRAFESGKIERGIDKISIADRLLVNNVNTANTSSAAKMRRRQKRH